MSSVHARQSRATGHYLRKRLRGGYMAWRLVTFAVCLFLVTVLCYRLGAVSETALYALIAGIGAAALLAALLAVIVLARVWRRGHQGGGRAVAALILSMLVLAPFLLGAVLAFEYPMRASARTQGFAVAAETAGAPDDPAAEAGGQADPGSDPDVSASTSQEEPLPSGRRFQAPASVVYGAARLALEDEGWEVAAVEAGPPPEEDLSRPQDLGVSGTVAIPIPTPRASIDMNAAADQSVAPEAEEYTIEAVAHTLVFGFPSDIVIRIVEEEGESFVDMSSTSRFGRHDLGQNERFISSFLAALEAAMAGIQGVPGEE